MVDGEQRTNNDLKAFKVSYGELWNQSQLSKKTLSGQNYVFFDGWISLNKTSILNLSLRYCCPEKFVQPFIKYLIKSESISMKMFLIQIFLCPVAGWKSTWSLLCQLEKKFATQKESAHLSDISQVGGNKLFSKLLKTLFASLPLLPPQPMFNKETMHYTSLWWTSL